MMGIRTAFNPLGGGKRCIYKRRQIIFESNTPGNYEVEILVSGKFEAYCIGGGAGALRNNYNSNTFNNVSIGGGSGAGFIGIIYLDEGILPLSVAGGGIGQAFRNSSLNYGVNTAALAGGTSTISNFVSASGGTPGSTGRDQMNPSFGGSVQVKVDAIETMLKANGNTGGAVNRTTASVSGGASLYEGHGKGGDVIGTAPQNGTPGYVKLIYLGR